MTQVTLTPEQTKAIAAIGTAIIDTVQDAGDLGVPGGLIYAAMQEKLGIPFHAFVDFMAAMVESGHITRRGELYFAKGRGAPQ